ncbi:MAG: helix-turn-helix transcriptional regulator [Syntrophales bacterium]
MQTESSPTKTPSSFLRIREVLTRFPVSRSTWWAGVREGRYPQGIKLSERTTAWRNSDIDRLIEQLSVELVPDRTRTE